MLSREPRSRVARSVCCSAPLLPCTLANLIQILRSPRPRSRKRIVTTLLTAKIVIEVERVPTDMTDVTAAALVGTTIALVGHRLHPGVVTTAGDRTLTIVTEAVAITTPSTENGHGLQTVMGDTDMMHTGVEAQAPMVGPARGATTSTYLVATETTCPTFRFS